MLCVWFACFCVYIIVDIGMVAKDWCLVFSLIAPHLLKQCFSLKLDIADSASFASQLASEKPTSHFLALELQVGLHVIGFYVDAGDSNSSSHAGMVASTLSI